MNDRDIKIINTVFRSEDGLTMTDIVESSALPQTTVYRTLQKLTNLRVLAKNGDLYVLGPVIVRWMNAEYKHQRYVDLIHPYLIGLSQEIEETVHLVQRIGYSAFYIDKVEGSGSFALKSRIGNELRLYQTGAGRAILMLFGPDELDAYFDQEELAASTEHTVTDTALLKKEIEQFKNQGYSLEVEQDEKNIQCIGVAFRLGGIDLAISVTATLLETTEKLKSFSEPLIRTVEKIRKEFEIHG